MEKHSIYRPRTGLVTEECSNDQLRTGLCLLKRLNDQLRTGLRQLKHLNEQARAEPCKQIFSNDQVCGSFDLLRNSLDQLRSSFDQLCGSFDQVCGSFYHLKHSTCICCHGGVIVGKGFLSIRKTADSRVAGPLSKDTRKLPATERSNLVPDCQVTPGFRV